MVNVDSDHVGCAHRFCDCAGKEADGSDAENEDGLTSGELGPAGGMDENGEGFGEGCLVKRNIIWETVDGCECGCGG